MTEGNKSSKPKYIFSEELGREKLCVECDEYYPLDDVFFYFQWVNRKGEKHKQYTATCKACYDIRYRPNRLERNRKHIKSDYEANL